MNDQPHPLSVLSNAVADNSATEGFILLQEVGWFRPTRASGSVAALGQKNWRYRHFGLSYFHLIALGSLEWALM